MGSPLIEARGLSVGYGTRRVVSDIDFTLNRGEIILLIGPNGGGKSTLLRTLLGAIPAISGEVLIDGDSLGALSTEAIARRLAFIPQDEESAFDFTAREMVSMGRLVHSHGWLESGEDRTIATQAMERNDCLQFQDRAITTLSGGERQRVLLSRAMAQQSPVLLLDEPNAHLDVRYQLELERFLAQAASAGQAVLAAIHDLNMALRLGAPAMLVALGKCSGPSQIQDLVNNGELESAYGVPFMLGEVGGSPTIRAG